jgi:DUF1365 family protein
MHAQSAIYECIVMHQRLRPMRHGFTYRVFYLWLDLDELDALHERLPLFSRNGFNLFSFYDRDHLGGDHADVKAGLMELLRSHAIETTRIDKVFMLAFPRVLGYGFNPVTFFYCYDQTGVEVCAVAQVTNTFREQKCYLIHPPEPGILRLVTPKHFYVSPFSSLDLRFDFQLQPVGQRLHITVDDLDGEERVLASALTGTRRALTNTALLVCALKYPLLTLKVITLIHWHALVLWLKRVPWFAKAANPGLQRDVLRPHSSISPARP